MVALKSGVFLFPKPQLTVWHFLGCVGHGCWSRRLSRSGWEDGSVVRKAETSGFLREVASTVLPSMCALTLYIVKLSEPDTCTPEPKEGVLEKLHQ